jgi:nicotinate-nucleotide adenylyltransferase
MNIGLFGGTFDPIHRGHIALARAAMERCSLGRIYFVPVGMHPLKGSQPSAAYFDRFTMVALATQEEKAFVPSLLEAPPLATAPAHKGEAPAPNFSIDTVRRFKKSLKKADRLFFLIGMDAFQDIAKWKDPEALLRECDFIVASRPGFSLADVANSLPERLRPSAAVTKPFHRQPAKGDLVLSGVTIHLLDNVNQPVSATVVRQAVAAKKPLGRLLDPKIEQYIKKRGLYGNKTEL